MLAYWGIVSIRPGAVLVVYYFMYTVAVFVLSAKVPVRVLSLVRYLKVLKVVTF